ncbi:hypothetical protein DFH11DRAFT_1607452 [Phellopilus nigrolimitatus]|nr:hypothetical protein DFH11DRAFT_1607452 [Phellopilus nigrolimitatus]
MRNIVDLLLTCQHRWHTLEISVNDLSVVQGLLDAMANLDNAPLLREFKLDFNTRNLKNDNYPAWKASYTGLTLHPKGEHSKYARLTGLVLFDCPSTESILWWIKRAPNLKTLNISTRIQQPEHLQYPSPHVWKLSNLSTLDLYGHELSDIEPLLAQLDLPKLTNLIVSTSMDDVVLHNWTYIEDLLSRSKPQALKELILDSIPISEDGIFNCLEKSPKLTYLCLDPMTNRTLNALTARKGRQAYCPVLEILEIPGEMTSTTFRILRDMVQSRLHDKRFEPLGEINVHHDTTNAQIRILTELDSDLAVVRNQEE